MAEALVELVRRALEEDVGGGRRDDRGDRAERRTRPRARSPRRRRASIYGLRAAELAFALLDAAVRFERLVEEGRWRERGGPVLARRRDAPGRC